MTKNALKSLYGTGHADATEKGKGIRNQVVLTPQDIVDGLLKFWPEGILYDPASNEGEHIPCEDGTRTRGLITPWCHRTYCNPPYGTSLFDPFNQMTDYLRECEIREAHREVSARRKKEGLKLHALSFSEFDGLPVKPKAGLKDWLKMQLTKSEGESIMLVPNRTHRKWFRDWKRKVTAVIELDPVTFHGWSSSCPFPLVLGFCLKPKGLAWHNHEGVRIEQRRKDFYRAFSHVGEPAR